MSKTDKRAFAKKFPSEGTKVPLAAKGSIVDAEEKCPVWRVQNLDLEGPFGWKTLDPSMLENLLRHLRDAETCTWVEHGRRGSHPVDVDRIAKEARDRLAERKQDDVDQLYSLRLEGKLRVWGIRDRWILKVMWWDPEHKVCPSLKKHT